MTFSQKAPRVRGVFFFLTENTGNQFPESGV